MKQRPFLALWTLAVFATVVAFVLHLGLRGKSVELGYKLGKARKEQARLRERSACCRWKPRATARPSASRRWRRACRQTPPPPERVIVLKDAVVPASRQYLQERRGRRSAVRNLPPARARWIKIRMALLCGIMAGGLGFVVSGADRIQNREGHAWLDMAERQRQRRLHIEPKRGTIYDRNGLPLAESVEVPSISVDAVEMLRGIDAQGVGVRIDDYAERIAAALSLPVDEVREKIARKRRFAWLKRRVSGEEVEAIRALGDSTSATRSAESPSKARAALLSEQGAGRPLLGFVSPDAMARKASSQPQRRVKGKASEMHGLRDRSGRLISPGPESEQALAATTSTSPSTAPSNSRPSAARGGHSHLRGQGGRSS